MKNQNNTAIILKTLKDFELADVKNDNFYITPINSGAINLNYKIEDGTKTFLLKIFTRNSVLPISRLTVFKMQEELAILGLAPQPIFLNDEGTIYCEQWIYVNDDNEKALEKDSQYLSAAGTVQPSKVEILAEVLYNIHTSFVSSSLVALDKHWQVYWQRLDSPSKALREKYRALTLVWEAYVKKNIDDFVLCHNDLHIDHISYPQGPVFDWEYAGLCCRFLDIANCCSINTLSQQETVKLCEHYAHLSDQNGQVVIEKVQEMSALVDFTNQLWEASVGIAGKA